jgi:hypothetical protein
MSLEAWRATALRTLIVSISLSVRFHDMVSIAQAGRPLSLRSRQVGVAVFVSTSNIPPRSVANSIVTETEVAETNAWDEAL